MWLHHLKLLAGIWRISHAWGLTDMQASGVNKCFSRAARQIEVFHYRGSEPVMQFTCIVGHASSGFKKRHCLILPQTPPSVLAVDTKPGQNLRSRKCKPSETLSLKSINPTPRVRSAFWSAMPHLVLLFGLTSSDDQERLDSRNRAYEGPEPLPKNPKSRMHTCCLHMKSPLCCNCHGRKGTHIHERLMLNDFARPSSLDTVSPQKVLFLH